MNGNPLNREEITHLLDGDPPLIEGHVALESQLQPNGFDLSLREVARFTTHCHSEHPYSPSEQPHFSSEQPCCPSEQPHCHSERSEESRPQLGASNTDRVLPETEPLPFDGEGWLELPEGAYLVTFNEIVNLPPDLMALGRPRSSLLRSGVALHTAVWDAGYHGRSQSLLTVHHPNGFRLQRNARVAQLVFFRLTTPPEQGYQGRYQGEGL